MQYNTIREWIRVNLDLDFIRFHFYEFYRPTLFQKVDIVLW